MPQAPSLPPEVMQQAQAGGAPSPAQFLLAAADMKAKGQLADAQPQAPVPAGKALPAFRRGQGRDRRSMQVVK